MTENTDIDCEEDEECVVELEGEEALELIEALVELDEAVNGD